MGDAGGDILGSCEEEEQVNVLVFPVLVVFAIFET